MQLSDEGIVLAWTNNIFCVKNFFCLFDHPFYQIENENKENYRVQVQVPNLEYLKVVLPRCQMMQYDANI